MTSTHRTGRPPLLFANKPESELTEEEKRLKAQIIKRRERQKRAYRRKKLGKKDESQAPTSKLEWTEDWNDEFISHNSKKDTTLTHFTRSNLSLAYASFSNFTTFRKHLVSELEQGLSSLDSDVQKLLGSFLVFPSSFTLEAALVVGNFLSPNVVEEILRLFLWKGFIYVDEDIRFFLNPLVRRYLEWHYCRPLNSPGRFSLMEAETAIYQYFYEQIKERARDHKIYVSGLDRKMSMKFVDRERDNILICLKHARRRSKDCLQDFLSKGGSIFRFGLRAEKRLHYFGDALGLCCCSEFSCSSHSKMNNAYDVSNYSWNSEQEAILLYHLAESYADAMQWEKAETFARCSIHLLEKLHLEISSCSYFPPLLLLGNILYETERFEEAKVSILSAMDSIRRFGLYYSSYTANAFILLVNLFLQENDIFRAQQTASDLLEIVNKIGFEDLPLFADTMGMFGLISYASGDLVEAERNLRLALESLSNWSCSHLWFDVPMKHCMHLDLWLMDSLSRVLRAQGKYEEADKYKEGVETIATERDICLRYVSDTSISPHKWTVQDLDCSANLHGWNSIPIFMESEETNERLFSNDSWNMFYSFSPNEQRVFIKHVC
ncbi:hypothetical protein GpartN1_g1870.t1 [Galdieria partita]|uniref:Uncharacterized protein n=1 Tax=Galdieria partita TaxID=83374 RepID=A0A9C7PTE6_9RHOD|nr:hypothetical protein GpartN1_g1870.t1 [Galdieria partita]